MFDIERVFADKIISELLHNRIGRFQITPTRRLPNTYESVIHDYPDDLAATRKDRLNSFNFQFLFVISG